MTKYKGNSGAMRTASLFYETWIDQKDPTSDPVFTFTGKPGLIDFRSTFVELNDVTGYEWAHKYLGSWEHFERLLKCSWFIPHFEAAVQEIETKWAKEAINKIREIANSEDTKQALGAARYVAEQGWKKKPSTRGRPSKQEIENAKRDAIRDSKDLQADLARIMEARQVKLVKS